MQRVPPSDEEVVEQARRFVASKRKFRWTMLFNGTALLVMTGYLTLAAIRKAEILDNEQLQVGFLYGLALSALLMTFGVLGGICLGKFLVGFAANFRPQELLVQYHDRLRDLGQLPDRRNDERTAILNRPVG